MPNTIYIYGDSHANTFIRANKLLESTIKHTVFKTRVVSAGRIQDEFVLKTIDDKPILNPAFTVCMQKDKLYPYSVYQRVLQEQKQIKVLLLFGSGLPHRLLLSQNSILKRYFEYFTSEEDRADHQVVPILKDMLKEELQLWQRYLFNGLSMLKDMGFSDIGLLSSPPLHRDLNYIFKKVNFESLAKKQGLERKFCFPSEHFRICLYRLSDDVMREKAQELNYQYISSPNHTMDEQGFLRSEYNFDGVHANTKYALEFATHIAKEAYHG